MAEFSIGEAERLTGLPAHTLRYWEETIPLIRPRKDSQGRRLYSSRDLSLILRVKHLVHDLKYTLEGASDRLLEELTAPGKDEARQAASELRACLLELYARVQSRDQSIR